MQNKVNEMEWNIFVSEASKRMSSDHVIQISVFSLSPFLKQKATSRTIRESNCQKGALALYASWSKNLYFFLSNMYLSQAVKCHTAFFTGLGNNTTFPQVVIPSKSIWEMLDRTRLNLSVCCSCGFPWSHWSVPQISKKN